MGNKTVQTSTLPAKVQLVHTIVVYHSVNMGYCYNDCDVDQHVIWNHTRREEQQKDITDSHSRNMEQNKPGILNMGKSYT